MYYYPTLNYPKIRYHSYNLILFNSDMSKSFNNQQAYRFIKVEDYFNEYKSWEKLTTIESVDYDKDLDILTLNFTRIGGKKCSVLLYFLQDDTIRFRFNPTKVASEYGTYKSCNTNSGRILSAKEDFPKKFTISKDKFQITTYRKTFPALRVNVTYNTKIEGYAESTFVIEIFNVTKKEPFLIWKTSSVPFYFTQNGDDEYAIIQSVFKPATAKYVGFGQQGGQSLSKNTAQVNYFNFDNMRYMQVYNKGPLDAREPLYHSEPIFFEYNGVPT